MKVTECGIKITEELKDTLDRIDDSQAESLLENIIRAKRVYVTGAGRSLLMIRAFAMRLMHLGFQVFVVGETVTPSIGKEDILIAASGSGETGSLCVIAQNAKKIGAKIALITIFEDSSIGKMADSIIKIPAPTTKVEKESGNKSIQPGGNLFEQCTLLLCDALVVRLAEIKGLDANQNIKLRHANLE
jgi:6-phospho-3-hexuloisomerase